MYLDFRCFRSSVLETLTKRRLQFGLQGSYEVVTITTAIRSSYAQEIVETSVGRFWSARLRRAR